MALPRKRRLRAPAGWSDDLHDYLHVPPQRRVPSGDGLAAEDGSIAVTNDWPDRVPITDAELRVIEGHLRGELDKLFGPLP